MIPIFPTFKKLTVEDKNEVEKATKSYPPYSDYNFVSLWSYNTKDSIEIALLNDNLVVKFLDYFAVEHFYSFLGTSSVTETITTLLAHAAKHNISQKLILIPEICVLSDKSITSKFDVQEDLDNFDYILSIPEISTLAGNKYGAKRNFVNRFVKNYLSISVVNLDLNDHKTKNHILELFYLWEKQAKKIRKDTQNELTAIERLLKAADIFSLNSIGIFQENKLIAFSIDEIVQNQYATIHFEKADTSFIGIFQYLKMITAQNLQKEGCLYINYEQDLGIEGLRKAKESWNPTSYLKKYIISYKK